MNIFKKIKLYKIYKESLKENIEFFKKEFKLEVNNWNELYTTISFVDAPDKLTQKLGKNALVEIEIKNYIKTFNTYLKQMNLNELYNLYDITKLNSKEYGITFGYSLMNNRQIIITKLALKVVPILIVIVTGLLLIF